MQTGTITAGGVAQNIFGSVPNGGWGIYNPGTQVLIISDVTTAAPNTAGCIPIQAGGGYETPLGYKSANIPTIYGATTGQPYTIVGGF